MHRNRAVKWLAGLLFIGIVCGTISLTWPHARLLLPRCTLVARGDQFDTFNWQSDHSILLFRVVPVYPYPKTLERVNLLTGHHVSYLPLAKQFAGQHMAATDFETSPDGKWLLWSQNEFNRRAKDRRIDAGWLANLKTGHLEHFPIGSMRSIDIVQPHHLYWMADSKRFA
jgi:hypothetical protein